MVWQKRVGVSARVVCADESIACALGVSGLERSERICFGAFAARVRVGSDVSGAFGYGGGSEYDSAKRRLKIRSASLQPTYFLVYVTHEINRRFWSDTRSPKVHRIKFEASLAKREALRGGECTEEAEGSRRGRTVFPRGRDVRAVRIGPSRPRATAARD